MKDQINKLDFIKIINFYASKDIKKLKRQSTDQKKIIANCISGK